VGKGNPVARIFLRSAADKRGAAVKVQVLYLTTDGSVRKVKKAGLLRGGDEWAPSRRFGLAQGQFSHGSKPTTPPGQSDDPPGQSDDPHGQSDDPHGQSDDPHGQGGDHGPGGDDAPGGAPSPDRRGSIQLRFTAAGSAFQIDDVFVDPRARY
jgi:hypothetical protein